MEEFFSVIDEAQVVFEELLVEYGISVFIVSQFFSGAGLLFFIPDETITPSFTLMFSNTILDVFFVATVAALAIVAGNFILYGFSRLLGEKLISYERRQGRYWRLMEWAIKGNAKISLVLLRLVPVFGGLAAIPAGLTRVPVKTFLIYSFIGFLIYEGILAFGIWYALEEEIIAEEIIELFPFEY